MSESLQSMETVYREYVLETLKTQTLSLPQESRMFTPELSPLQMQYRAEIIMMMQDDGWFLTHWAVAGQYPFILGYPVFERTGEQ